MDTLLLVTTLISIATTFALFGWILRMRRDERDRSEARVAALAEGSHAMHEEPGAGYSGAGPGIVRTEFVENTSAAPVANVFGARSLFSDASADGAVDPGTSWTVPVLAITGAALVILIALLGGGRGTSTADATGVQIPQERGRERLELVALMHERRADVLLVSGTVVGFAGSPPAGDPVNAIVSTFDRSGRLLGQVRVPVKAGDARNSDSGSGSFSASIPDGAAIGRYRVSFERGGRVLSHVDRRSHAGTGARP